MFFHNSSKIECRWISLNAFEMSSAIMTQSGLASKRSVIAFILLTSTLVPGIFLNCAPVYLQEFSLTFFSSINI